MSAHYFNTTNLTGDALKKAVTNANNQEQAILLIFTNTRSAYSPSQIMALCEKAGRRWPIHSIRARMTELTTNKHLIKTMQKREGLYKEDEHIWKLNPDKYPNPVKAEQSKMF